ncbi:Ubiquinone biosynthesis O-methyltransferase [Candidatus Methanobinarius endosymbioticus]|uniref:Ubiquinone biosynthesis O-methyltransferase n=1 Tax=Candidatus Methanobinarius endosymbioticus TaxID=2006182 RepID=A0A366M993_9EURY|nr:Ubiquinone biosynthesis O-methyltransferase [Candidatus Methanobinarius endosymbioticus]
MKFYTTTYHSDLIKDTNRLSAFLEGIIEVSNTFNNFKNIDKNNKINENINENEDKNNENNIFNLKNKINFEKKKNSRIALDIGCGSGVLSYFASKCFDSVLGIDIDEKIINYAKKSFFNAEIENVSFINDDASSYDFSKLFNVSNLDNDSIFEKFTDLIICEMLDTALINEEEIPVLNNIQKYLKNKDNVKILPKGIINVAEPVFMEKDYINYEDEEFHGNKPQYEILGGPVKYLELNFLDNIDPAVETVINFNLNDFSSNVNTDNFDNNMNKDLKSHFNGIKITTFTLITDNILCGPTPMFNPPLFVPVPNINTVNETNNSNSNYIKNEKKHEKNISLKLEYLMGGGVETIKTKIIN